MGWFDYESANIPTTQVTFTVLLNGVVEGNMLDALGPLSNDMLYRFLRSFRASSDVIEPIMHRLPLLILQHYLTEDLQSTIEEKVFNALLSMDICLIKEDDEQWRIQYSDVSKTISWFDYSQLRTLLAEQYGQKSPDILRATVVRMFRLSAELK